ncbi:hypothetical protein M407DRAFT_6152 [Tulasnella calospora MUT 4182]|uniref:Uncharacterized protein n=1 Tax=Tulasnella calospora MUT 4182 TaxID=1051891 RepID=A0A0C3QN89_9AGAM|nr:hypothetical protein M407DRAFT_6152 [Tulasnella calospora MUT 4182]
MSGLVLPQLLKEEYPSYPGTAPAAPSLEQEAKSIWEKNREYLEGFKNDILTSEPRSKEFRFAIRVAKHFFRTDNTYDASGVAEALQFIDVIRKRHEAVVATSAERQLLQSVRKVLSVIFQHHHKFNDPRDLQMGAEAPNPPFNNPYNTNLSMAIDPALTNSTEPQRPVIRPPPHLSQSPVHHSDLSSPTPLRSTDPATFLSFFDQSSTSNGLALPFQIEHQLSMNEVTVEQPLPTVSVRPPNRVASLLMRAMAAKKAAQIEAPVVEPSDPIVASTGPVVAPSDPIVAPADPIAALIQMEDFQDPEDAEMQAGEPPLEEDMVFQWTLPPEPVSSSPQKKEPVVVEDTPMETLAPEVVQDEVPDVEEPVMEDTQMETLVPEDTQDEVPDVEEPKLEGEDDVTESSLTNVSTPSLPHPDPPATEPEPELPEVIQPSPLSSKVVRRIDLNSGKTLQVYKGHTGPVTCLTFYDKVDSDGSLKTFLITGSWDKTKAVVSDTPAHEDFVKTLLVIPSSRILASGSSDKLLKLWDLDGLVAEGEAATLHQLASISGHRRPVETLATPDSNPNHLVSGDSMGVMKAWNLEERWRASSNSLPNVRATPTTDIGGHRTGVNDIVIASSYLWTASTDETVTIRRYTPANSSSASSSITSLEHPNPVRCLLLLPNSPIAQPFLLTGHGDVIRIYDVSELVEEDEDPGESGNQKPLTEVSGVARLLNEVDAHSHSVTSLQLWLKTSSEVPTGEPWIVSGSLDGTVRKWRLSELVAGKKFAPAPPEPTANGAVDSMLTEEEERELAELMEDD